MGGQNAPGQCRFASASDIGVKSSMNWFTLNSHRRCKLTHTSSIAPSCISSTGNPFTTSVKYSFGFATAGSSLFFINVP